MSLIRVGKLHSWPCSCRNSHFVSLTHTLRGAHRTKPSEKPRCFCLHDSPVNTRSELPSLPIFLHSLYDASVHISLFVAKATKTSSSFLISFPELALFVHYLAFLLIVLSNAGSPLSIEFLSIFALSHPIIIFCQPL